MGRIKDIGIELQELETRYDELAERYFRLKAWFLAALLHNDGMLKKTLFPIQGNVYEYIRHCENQGLSIEKELGGYIYVELNGEMICSAGELLQSIPEPKNQNTTNTP